MEARSAAGLLLAPGYRYSPDVFYILSTECDVCVLTSRSINRVFNN
ncbi:rCG61000, partial [Rattus norvegicus]